MILLGVINPALAFHDIWHFVTIDIWWHLTFHDSLTFHDISHFMTFDISWHLTFHDIWHLMTFDISWHLKFHDIWQFVTFDISWLMTFHDIWHLMIFDISWHLKFHDNWHVTTFDISWHLTFHSFGVFQGSEFFRKRSNCQFNWPNTYILYMVQTRRDQSTDSWKIISKFFSFGGCHRFSIFSGSNLASIRII